MRLDLIVTGTGRCGTTYMAKLLTSLGIPCGHESYFCINSTFPFILKPPIWSDSTTHNYLTGKSLKPHVKKKDIVADSSWFAAPFLDELEVREKPVIHLVRHPLKVMSSMIAENSFAGRPFQWPVWTKFKQKYTPAFAAESTVIGRVVRNWLDWNQLIIDKINLNPNRRHMLHRVENGASPELLDFLGVKKPDVVFDNRSTNKRKNYTKIVKISDIPDEMQKPVIELAAKFGYPYLDISFGNNYFL